MKQKKKEKLKSYSDLKISAELVEGRNILIISKAKIKKVV